MTVVDEQRSSTWLKAAWTSFIALIVILYYQTLNAPFIYDDKIEVIGNRTIRTFEEWQALIGYNPSRLLLELSYAANLQQGGLEPFVFHVTNIVIHCLSAGAALWLALGLCRLKEKPPPVHVPILIAGMWALHPMAAEGVSYITGRSESLCALFCFLAMGAWAQAIGREREARAGLPWRTLGVFCCLLAVLCKEVGLMCPLAILAMEKYAAGNSWRQIRWLSYTPFLLLFGLGAWLRFRAVQGALPDATMGELFGGMIPKEVDRDPGVQLLTQAQVWLRYVALWLAPIDQTIYHHVEDVQPSSLEGVVSGIGWLGLCGGGFWATRDKPVARWALIAGALFLIPSSSIAPLKENMAEHRAHQLGFYMMTAIALSADRLWTKAGSHRLLCILALPAALCFFRNKAWQSEIAIWEEAVAHNPEIGEAWYGLGDAYRFAKPPRREKAEEAFIECVKRDPGYISGWNNLGLVRAQMGKQRAAELSFKQALKVKDGRCADQSFTICKCKAHNNLGKLQATQGKFKLAEAEFRSAFVKCPKNVLTHYFLGELYRGPVFNKKKAIFHLETVLKLDPEFSEAETVQKNIDSLTF